MRGGVKDKLVNLFIKWENTINSEPHILCHGDLSNVNMLQRNGKAYIVDWEDAIWGVRGYDFLYWLTFMDQRTYMRKDTLQALGLCTERSKFILCFIILMKSYVSYKNKSYLNNKVTFSRRLQEAMDVFD